jgi:iron complex outermembrane receptor protein
VPASIDRVDSSTLSESRLQVNISENLGGVAGLLARDRQNYAQDVQISMRGFGSRATFGIRGVRLYVDGIPATLPDGQGQISHVDLGSTERIEVLRGPFSSLYGNSSGGVVQVFTEEGQGPPTGSVGLAGWQRRHLAPRREGLGGSGDFGYVASASAFRTDGYRDHSEAERNIGNLKLNWNGRQMGKLTLVLNDLSLPRRRTRWG